MSRIIVERENDNRIKLTGWVGPNTPALCRAVGGGRFVPAEQGGPHWAYPLDLTVCRQMRHVFGKELAIGPALNIWARDAIKAETSLAALAVSADAELLRVPADAPVLDAATKNRTYQRVAARFGAETGSFLLADQPGLGKTLETLATIIETAPESGETQHHLIFCPSVAVLNVWAPEVTQWLAGANAVVVPLVGTLPQRESILANLDVVAAHVFVVTNIESVRIKPHTVDGNVRYRTTDALVPSLFTREWDTVVVDESHRGLIRRKGTPSQQRAGFTHLRSRRRIALSGTPMRGKPEQLWGTLNWLRPDLFTSYWTWVGRYWKLLSNGYSQHVLGDFQDGGEDRLMADLRPLVLRRTKAEVLKELPPKTYAGHHLIPGDPNSPHGVWLEMTPKHRKQFEKFTTDGTIEFADGQELIANGVLVEYTRRKQLSSAVHLLNDAGKLVPTTDSPKYEWLRQFVEELDGERVVVASQFTSLIDVFAEALRAESFSCHVLTGKTSQANRTKMVQDFQSDTPSANIFFLNTQAGGVALTLDASDYLVLLDETTIPDDQEQVEDRIHRTSRMHNVTIYYLRTLDTQDEEVAWIAAARENVQKYLLDGTRGIDYARKVYAQSTSRKA